MAVAMKGKDTLTVLVSVSLLQGGDILSGKRLMAARQQSGKLDFRVHVIMSACVRQSYEIFHFSYARTYSINATCISDNI